MNQLYDKKTSQEIRNVTSSFKQLNEEVKKLNKTVSSAALNMAEKFREVGSATKEVDAAISKTSKTMSEGFDDTWMVNTVALTQNVFDALTSLLAPSLGFQQNMANISASTGIAGKDLDELSRVARQVGIQTGEGATAASAAFQTLASQVDVNKVGLEGLKTLQQETATLSQASGLSMNEAANVLGGTINQFGLSADEASRVVNVLAAGSLTGAAGINDLAASFNETARNAAASGLSLEETTGALELLSQNNLKGAEAGTAFNKILDSLRTSLGEDLGGAGLSEALQTLQPLLTDTAALTSTFGTENASTAAFLISNATALDGYTTALTDTGVAQEQAAIRSDTVAEQMERMKARIDDVKLSIFEATGGFTGYLSAVSDTAVTIAQLLPLMSALKGLTVANTTATTGSTVATKLKTIAEKTSAGITGIMTTVQKGLNTAMKANPIGMLVTAGAAAYAIFTMLYDRFEGFRQVMNGVGEVMADFGSKVVTYAVEPFKKLLSGLSTVMGAMGSLIEGNFAEAGQKAKEGLANIFSGVTQINPGVILANAAYNTDYKGAYKRGSEKKEETKVEVVPEIDMKAMQDELQKLLKDAPKIEIPILNQVVPPKAIPPVPSKANPKAAGVPVEERRNMERLEAPSLGAVAAMPDLKNGTEQLNALNQSLMENRNLTVEQSGVWELMAEKMQGMANATQPFVEGMKSLGEGMIQSFSQSSESMEGFAEQTGNVIRKTISGIIALGVSYMVMNALQSASFGGPFGFLIAPALAALAGGLASTLFNSLIPSFANGGIVYGNTLAQVGEYPGAANNPEVIAPLSKLRSLLQPTQASGGTVEFVIKGNRLVGVLNKESNKGKYF